MQTFEQIKRQVGEWNILNFGNQETPHIKLVDIDALRFEIRTRLGATGAESRFMVAELGSLAPLMGMMEELGELYEADALRDPADAQDATGDIGIYLCDYCCREGINFPSKPVLAEVGRYDPLSGMVIYLGRLYHCTLKRHQGIRGMAFDGLYHQTRDGAVNGFAWHLHKYAHVAKDINLLTILNMTWHKVVKKRDWRTDPNEGGGHSHEAGVSDE